MQYKHLILLSLLLASIFPTAALAGRGGGKKHHGDAPQACGQPYAAYESASPLWYYGRHDGLPPGLARKNRLPPGIQKHLLERGSLPPGLQKRVLAPNGYRSGWREYPPSRPGLLVIVNF